MPGRFNANYLPPKEDDEFEELLRDICELEWGDPRTERFARSGQKQWGVDVYGQPGYRQDGCYYGIQCKLKPSGKQLTKTQIEDEVRKAQSFKHPLCKYIIATDRPRDNKVQLIVDEISERNVRGGSFPIEIWFWPYIERLIATYPRILIKHYYEFVVSLTNMPVLERLVERPLEILTLTSSGLDDHLVQALRLRGIRIRTSSTSPVEAVTASTDMLPDGVLVQAVTPSSGGDSASLLPLTTTIIYHNNLVEDGCPVFIVAEAGVVAHIKENLRALQESLSRYTFITEEVNNAIADKIFVEVFRYGYERRAFIPTINVTARTTPTKPAYALLDMDWGAYLGPHTHPSKDIWESVLAPSLVSVTNQLASLSEATRIQVDSTLPVPASLAVGYALNLHVALLGVWGRIVGRREVKHLWLADADPANISLHKTWHEAGADTARVAVVELYSGFSIHNFVSSFVEESGLSPDTWVEVCLQGDEDNSGNIDEARAVACADQMATLLRQLTERGVTDFHLFLRIPSALAVLIGQKLHACGRLHLYWFDRSNSSYKRAFTLY